MTDSERFFNEIRYIDRQIDSKLEQLARMKEMQIKITASINDDPVRTSGNSRSVEYSIDRIQNLNDEINKEIYRLIDMKRKAIEYIEMLPDIRKRIVLQERYINCKQIEKVADSIGYSTRHTSDLIHVALQEIQKFF